MTDGANREGSIKKGDRIVASWCRPWEFPNCETIEGKYVEAEDNGFFHRIDVPNNVGMRSMPHVWLPGNRPTRPSEPITARDVGVRESPALPQGVHTHALDSVVGESTEPRGAMHCNTALNAGVGESPALNESVVAYQQCSEVDYLRGHLKIVQERCNELFEESKLHAAALAERDAEVERLKAENAALWDFVKARDELKAANKQFINHDITEHERSVVFERELATRRVLSELWNAKQDASAIAAGKEGA